MATEGDLAFVNDYGKDEWRFPSGGENDKLRFSGHPQKTICRYSAILIYAFKGPLPEGAGSAVFFRRDWRRLDLGFCVALDLIFFRLFRGRRYGKEQKQEAKPKVNPPPPASPEPPRRGSQRF